ncbi:hypothetical protein D3C87_1519490 [compost metagenome]
MPARGDAGQAQPTSGHPITLNSRCPGQAFDLQVERIGAVWLSDARFEHLISHDQALANVESDLFDGNVIIP